MKTNVDEKQIKGLLTRGVNEVIDFSHLRKRLLSGEKLRIKLGIDPTSPHIHLGRAVSLLKLRDFQNLGHKVVFIIGDFTGVVGDTSDKESERPMLFKKQVEENMKTYIRQAGKILDMEKTEICHNSTWLKKLGYEEIGKQANQFSLAEFINRENIKKRLNLGTRVSLRELLYPLMQGYDSVEVKADVELGGTDQRFNLLAGRTLQEYYGQKPQDVMMTNLILGTDGRKMSSSWGNTINIVDKPSEMFGKIMSLTDDLIITYFEHCTRVDMDKVKKYSEELKAGKNPKDVKMDLAYEITKIYWGEKKSEEAKDYFITVFQKKGIPQEISKMKLANKNILEILVLSKLAKSKSDARRLIGQKGVTVDGKTIESTEETVKKGSIIQKGKRYFVKII
ncbi:MAG: tyrosine--tRNA ligase [Patescibacteria group bacterium]|nr:tyrosine--tRNA ligase [Patescibacteria group bacterium]MDD5172682.1 tyrosine--tRNA ligase [Patescibacteria group bacterium]